MKDSPDYLLQDLVEASEALLEEVDQTADLASKTSAETERKINNELLKKFVVDEEKEAEYPADGYAEVTISVDGMSARADFFPPAQGGQPLSPEAFSRSLQANGIRYGIDWEAIKAALLRCNTTAEQICDVLVASGQAPRDQTAAHLLIEERLLQGPQRPDLGGGQVDLREIGQFIIVRKGDVLARLVPERPGAEGYTVR